MAARMAAGRLRAATQAGWPSLFSALLALALYSHTMAPGLTWANRGSDGGDFLAAALTGGVPHPSGYPTYQLLLRAAIALFPGEPARAGNWLSALCAAAAVALFADLVRRLLPRTPWREFVAFVSALAVAASPVFWSQAVLTEVHTLHALVIVGLLWLLCRWRQAVSGGRPGGGWLIGAGFFFGLGLGNHMSTLFMAPSAAALLWSVRRDVPSRRGWRWPAVVAAIVLGMASYLYLPWAAWGDPPVNWGDPRTPSRLWEVLTGRIYGSLIFGLAVTDLPGRLSAWIGHALDQFGGGPWGALIAFAGLWWQDRHDHAWWRATVVVALSFSAYALGYNTEDSYLYLIPVWVVGGLWFALGLSWGLEAVIAGRSSRRWRLLVGVPLGMLLLALPAASAWRFWTQVDASHNTEAEIYLFEVLSRPEKGAVILVSGDRRTFALWYAIYGLGRRRDLTPLNVKLYAFDWYRRTLATHHPDVFGREEGDLPPLEAVLSKIALQRPVYRAESLDVSLPGFAEHLEGSLVRMELR